MQFINEKQQSTPSVISLKFAFVKCLGDSAWISEFNVFQKTNKNNNNNNKQIDNQLITQHRWQGPSYISNGNIVLVQNVSKYET